MESVRVTLGSSQILSGAPTLVYSTLSSQRPTSGDGA
jgi:hypothetical protein